MADDDFNARRYTLKVVMRFTAAGALVGLLGFIVGAFVFGNFDKTLSDLAGNLFYGSLIGAFLSWMYLNS